MKRMFILLMLMTVLILIPMTAYYFINYRFFDGRRLFNRESDLNIYKIRISPSREEIAPLPVAVNAAVLFSGRTGDRSRDIFCRYEDGTLHNISNTKGLNEIKIHIANNSEFIAFELLQKINKRNSIGFIDLKDYEYFLISPSENSGNLVASSNSPYIAFTNWKNNRWELIIFDLHSRQVMHREYNDQNNCIPSSFSDCGMYLYWRKVYPLKKRVSSIMRTEIRSSNTELLVPHNYTRHSRINEGGNIVYFSADYNGTGQKIYQFDTKTKDKRLFFEKEGHSSFVHLIGRHFLIIAYRPLSVSSNDLEEDSGGPVAANVPTDYAIIKRRDNDSDNEKDYVFLNKKLFENTDTIFFAISDHPEKDNFLICSELIQGKGMFIRMVDLLTDTHYTIESLPVSYHPKFFILQEEYHPWKYTNK